MFDAEIESDEDSLFKKPNLVQSTITSKPKKQESLFDDDDTSDDASSLQTKEVSIKLLYNVLILHSVGKYLKLFE